MKKFAGLVLSLILSGTLLAQEKKTVPVNEFEKGIADKKVILLDVRRPEEFNDGHIKGALNANWQNPEEFKAKVATLDKSKKVYVYCLSGVRSGKAADYLVQNGYTQVVALNGGVEAWKEAGKPLQKP